MTHCIDDVIVGSPVKLVLELGLGVVDSRLHKVERNPPELTLESEHMQ